MLQTVLGIAIAAMAAYLAIVASTGAIENARVDAAARRALILTGAWHTRNCATAGANVTSTAMLGQTSTADPAAGLFTWSYVGQTNNGPAMLVTSTATRIDRLSVVLSHGEAVSATQMRFPLPRSGAAMIPSLAGSIIDRGDTAPASVTENLRTWTNSSTPPPTILGAAQNSPCL